MKYLLKSILHILIISFLFACSSGDYKITSAQSDIRNIQSIQAEQTAQIANLRETVRKLSGKIDELSFRNRRTSNIASNSNSNSLSQNFKKAIPSIIPKEELESDEILIKKLDSNLAASFSSGLNFIKQGQYKLGIDNIDNAFDKAFGTKEAVNVFFWKGIAYEGLKDYKKALSVYKDLVGNYPRHPRTELALLRQGSLFIRLGEFQIAKLSLQKLIADYPRSKYAIEAKKKLKGL